MPKNANNNGSNVTVDVMDLLSPEEQEEYQKVTAKLYRFMKADNDIERYISKLLCDEATVQDVFNLYTLYSKFGGNTEKRKTANEAIDPIGKFITERLPKAGDAASYHYVEEEHMAGCKLKFKKSGHIILSAEDKKELLQIKMHFNKEMHPDDLQLIKSASVELGDEAKEYFEANGIVVANSNVDVVDVDREKNAISVAKDYMKQHPEALNSASINGTVKTSENNKANNINEDHEREKEQAFEELQGSIKRWNDFTNDQTGASQVSDDQKRALLNDMKEAGESIKTLKESWKAMKSHTMFSFMNSSEFKKMEKAFDAYVKAYDNLMAGRTIDGKAQRSDTESIEPGDVAKFKELQTKMQAAAQEYAKAKRAQKGGGIDEHSTRQGKDRLAMAGALANFDLISMDTTAEAVSPYEVTNAKTGVTRTVTLSQLEGNERGRINLQHQERKLQRAEQKSKGNDGMKM